MSEKDSTAFQKGHFCSPCSPKLKAGGTLAPLCPSLRRAWTVGSYLRKVLMCGFLLYRVTETL